MRRSVFYIFLTQSLMACVFAIGCQAPAGSPRAERKLFHVPNAVSPVPQHPLPEGLPGVPNFGVITHDVWRGGEPSPEGLQVLADIGVKTIIDLREEGNESTSIPSGVRYIRLPVSAWHADRVDTGQVLRAISQCPKPVFIHCHQGRDRTGLAVAAYRLSTGMKPQDACTELVNFHINAWWQGPIEARIYALARLQKSEAPTSSLGRPAPTFAAASGRASLGATPCAKMRRFGRPIGIATQRETISLSRAGHLGVTSRRHAGYASCSSATTRATSCGSSTFHPPPSILHPSHFCFWLLAPSSKRHSPSIYNAATYGPFGNFPSSKSHSVRPSGELKNKNRCGHYADAASCFTHAEPSVGTRKDSLHLDSMCAAADTGRRPLSDPHPALPRRTFHFPTRLHFPSRVPAASRFHTRVPVSYPFHPGWKLTAPAKADETTESLYRFQGTVGAGKSSKLNVQEELTQNQQFAILPMDIGQVLQYSKTGEIPKTVRDALAKAVALKNDLSDTQRQIQEHQQKLPEITQEQARIRENLKTVLQNTDYYQRLLKKLDEQLTAIEKLQGEVKTLQQKQATQQQALEQYLQNLDIS